LNNWIYRFTPDGIRTDYAPPTIRTYLSDVDNRIFEERDRWTNESGQISSALGIDANGTWHQEWTHTIEGCITRFSAQPQFGPTEATVRNVIGYETQNKAAMEIVTHIARKIGWTNVLMTLITSHTSKHKDIYSEGTRQQRDIFTP